MTDTAIREPEVVADEAPRPAPRWKTALTGDFAKVLLLVVAWQVFMTVLGRLIEPLMPVFEGTPPSSRTVDTLLSHTHRWDAENFTGIVEGTAYQNIPTSQAFYPVFPLFVWLVKMAFFGKIGTLVAGFIVNTVALWLGAVALLKIARNFLAGERGPWIAVMVMLTLPSAYFLHAFYSESVFIALGFWAYLFALRRQWVFMGLCLMPLTGVRITAVLFVGLCFLEFWRSKDWKFRGLLSWHLLWFPLSAVGFIGFAIYLKILVNDPLGMTKAYSKAPAWAYHKFSPNIFATLYEQTKVVFKIFTGRFELAGWSVANYVVPWFGLMLLIACSLYLLALRRGDLVPVGLYGLASVVMLTLNQNLVSVHRYLLPCFGIYLALVLLGQRVPALKSVVYGVMYVGLTVQTLFYLQFVAGLWTG
ncbi:hypothetical protein [Lentzea nigeriaca]|uniref:hypothetical protein n=1 Tax=Lentzea nigeriaca TaxID=1128665 RepID=UPI00195989F9|nr:hypothetical protein [Lentzea nigeriaca]MBM7859699.1 hypothetical protein [Lentzea nigeriaca]